MSVLDSILGVLRDPPPEFAFEISSDGIAMSRTRPPAATGHVALAPGIIAPSPVKENILNAAAFAEAVRSLVPPAGSRTQARNKRGAALILPDNCVRIAVLDFDNLPEKEEERRPLINFRLRKSVPFDIDEAALSYLVQDGNKVIVALAPSEIVAHYESAFRGVGLHPGLVTVSSLAMLELLPAKGSVVAARLSPGVLTVVALSAGVVTIARSLELTEPPAGILDEIVADIYPTLAYLEDRNGVRPERLYIAGFGETSETSATRLSIELDIPLEPMNEPHPGLAGYLASLHQAKLGPEKKAAA